MEKPDSIIFDMDGTLWDAVDTYTESWNIVFKELGIDKTVDKDDLAKMVGWEGKKVWNAIMPGYPVEKQEEIYGKVNDVRKVLLPQKGGVLYDGVKEGLAQLATKYELFIVSNCAKGIIRYLLIGRALTSILSTRLLMAPIICQNIIISNYWSISTV